MTSKFFPPRPRSLGFAGITATLVLFACSAFCQPRPVYDTNTNVSHIRFWNLLPPDSPPIDVTMPDSDGTAHTALRASRSGSTSGTTYWQFDPGTATFTISTPDSDEEIDRLAVQVRRGDYKTVIAIPDDRDGSPKLEVLDDTYKFAEDTPGEIAIFNALPDVTGQARISGSNTSPVSIGTERTVSIGPLPTTSGTLDLTLSAKDSRPIRFSIPFDFQDCRRVAVLIIQDRYGRLRPLSMPRGFINERAEMTTDAEAP